ncbi:YbaB/EbfC family nucleoid-associated protein [Actinokineospora pegani]|uniref:YbaB/EbfC family nucleoid-associated protein n=1 Tax=Actinokineospora pegani TaxID=2654637 RepID=UPI0012E9DDA7|nr:YbaB/EbfC family nucleoid-associated protein [Actinokineospora pegani]
MTSPHPDPDSQLAALHAQIDAKLVQADQLQAVSEQLRVAESSRDGSVTVTVDSTGNVVDLVLTDAAQAKRPEENAAMVLATLRAAQARLSERMREALTPLLGAESETMGMLMSGYEGRFGTPPPPPARDYDAAFDDDDWRR